MTKKHSKNSIKKNDRIHQYIFKKPRKLYYKYIKSNTRNISYSIKKGKLIINIFKRNSF